VIRRADVFTYVEDYFLDQGQMGFLFWTANLDLNFPWLYVFDFDL